MNSETKLFVGILVATAAIIGAAAFFFSGQSTAQKVDSKLLVRDDSYKTGTGSAVMLVEFGDYQCPACGAYHPLLKQVLKDFAGQLTFVFREFPLPMHPNAPLAAQAAQAAGLQGKYWEMHDVLYEKQSQWSQSANARDIFTQYAKDIGLDTAKFAKDIDSDVVKNRVTADTNDGNTLGVNATPTFYINSEKIQNPGSLADFETLIKAAILKAPKPSISASAAYHIHANIKVMLDGKPLDFTLAKYQSVEGKELNPNIHFHDGKGDLLHIHKKGMTLGDLFTSFGMTLTSTCFTTDTKQLYCNAQNKTLRMYVNGIANAQFATYEPQDLDRILITYGNENDAAILSQVHDVVDDACIYSEKCPERGTPPTENCVGGLGTDCSH